MLLTNWRLLELHTCAYDTCRVGTYLEFWRCCTLPQIFYVFSVWTFDDHLCWAVKYPSVHYFRRWYLFCCPTSKISAQNVWFIFSFMRPNMNTHTHRHRIIVMKLKNDYFSFVLSLFIIIHYTVLFKKNVKIYFSLTVCSFTILYNIASATVLLLIIIIIIIIVFT